MLIAAVGSKLVVREQDVMMMKKNKSYNSGTGSDVSETGIVNTSGYPLETLNIKPEEALKLLYHYETRIAELENDNRELKKALDRTMSFTNLYDFSPIVFLSVTAEGLISDLNHSAAGLLGKERQSLVNADFSSFLTDESVEAFRDFLKTVFRDEKKQTCLVRFNTETGLASDYWLIGYNFEDNEYSLMLTCVLKAAETGGDQ